MKSLKWVGTSLKDIKAFPEEVRKHVGYALHQAQCGEPHPDTKPLKGIVGVMEMVSRFNKDTYRAAYYAKIETRD